MLEPFSTSFERGDPSSVVVFYTLYDCPNCGDHLWDLTARGLGLGTLTIADGHLGIWAALVELHPEGKEQRCWNHKIANVLDVMPKRIRAQASEYLTQIPYAETQAECESLREGFLRRYEMVTFYRFPKEHWLHIRTTNVVESPFSSVRLRTDAARWFKKVANATAMIWKLLGVAEKRFRRLKGYWLLKCKNQGPAGQSALCEFDVTPLVRTWS